MRRHGTTFLVVPFMLALLCCRAPAGRALSLPVAKQRGMCYASWQQEQYAEPDADVSLGHLADAGAEWLGLVVTRYQASLSSTTITSTLQTPTDADLVHVITQAHARGLKVMLKPHVDLSDDPSHWRGQIGSAFTSEAQWAAWFASYRETISHYATLAQQNGVEQFCLGTELSGTTGRAQDWRAVVADVRGHFTGTVLYEANFGGEETSITWWDAVDYIGISAYYPLTQKNDPTLAELKAGWAAHVRMLGTLSARWNKLILFPEIGYRSQDGANKHPWDYQLSAPIDVQEQALCYQAALESVWNQPWFAGTFWWVWSPDPFEGGVCDDGYTPYDKPAEDVLRAWYGAPSRSRAGGKATPQPDDSVAVTIYADALAPGWEDWSWDATRNLTSTAPVYAGTYAIAVNTSAYGALSLHHEALDTSPYYYLEFWVRGATPGQKLWAFFDDVDDKELRKRTVDDCRYLQGGTIEAGAWKRVLIPLGDMAASKRAITRLSLQDRTGSGASFSVDEIRLVGAKWVVDLPLLVK